MFIEQCKVYVDIFGKMNRLNELKKYYHQCEKAKHIEKLGELNKETNSLISSSLSTVASSGTTAEASSNYATLVGDLIKNFLKSWLDHALESWQSEVTYNHETNIKNSIENSFISSRFNGVNKYSPILMPS